MEAETMKFWQLLSVVGNNKQLVESVADSRAEWQWLVSWCQHYDTLVNEQDRAKLDHQLPEELVLTTLDRIKGLCFLSKDGWLRSREFDKTDQPMTFVNIYQKYGGDVLENVLEYGSVRAVS